MLLMCLNQLVMTWPELAFPKTLPKIGGQVLKKQKKLMPVAGKAKSLLKLKLPFSFKFLAL